MSTHDGLNVCPKCKSAHTSADTRHVSKQIQKKLYPAQIELLEFIEFQDTSQIIKSLEWVHNTALYHSDVFIDDEEKINLFNVRLLMERLGDMVCEV